MRVTLAVDAGVPFQGAADVELRVDDRPVVVDLDPFELGKTAAPPAASVYCDVREVEADLGADRARRRGGIGTSGLLGKSSATNRRNDASKAGLPQAASANSVPPPGSRCCRRASRSSLSNESAARPWM